MDQICEGRTVIVTGAGRGIGREHALSLARHGANVVVNDLGADVRGVDGSESPAAGVVAEIEALGGRAIASGHDVSDFDQAHDLVELAVTTFGDLHGLVNNAGILRDRMLVNMTEEEWDAVIRVHLKGTFGPMKWALDHWRTASKQGRSVSGRIVNTTSVSGIYGNVGQGNYGAAKAGIASLTVIAAVEAARFGVTVNAVAPVALTRMTEDLGWDVEQEADKERLSPKWIAPIVTWLNSEESRDVTGRVFEASGDFLAVAEGWTRGPQSPAVAEASELGATVADLLSKARPNSGMDGQPGTPPQPQP